MKNGSRSFQLALNASRAVCGVSRRLFTSAPMSTVAVTPRASATAASIVIISLVGAAAAVGAVPAAATAAAGAAAAAAAAEPAAAAAGTLTPEGAADDEDADEDDLWIAAPRRLATGVVAGCGGSGEPACPQG